MALSAVNTDADIPGMASDEEIYRALSGTEVFDADLFQKRRQKRIGKADLGRMAADRQPQAGLEEEKDGRCCPRLWGTGDWVQRRPLSWPPRKTAEQLGHTTQIHEQTGIEQP